MIVIKCGKEELELDGEDPHEIILNEYGWLLNPIIERVGNIQNALEKLNWEVIKK